MKLILKEDIHGLGYKDDVVEVKSGYGRNYLIPQGKAVIASPMAIKVLEENKRQRAHKLAKIKADAEAQAAALQDVKLLITVKAGENGVIYGSVNAAQIADELAKLGKTIDRKAIELTPVKTLGEHTAKILLHRDITVTIPFEVVAENAEPAAEAPATTEA